MQLISSENMQREHKLHVRMLRLLDVLQRQSKSLVSYNSCYHAVGSGPVLVPWVLMVTAITRPSAQICDWECVNGKKFWKSKQA